MSRLHREIDKKDIENHFDIIDVISKYTDLRRKGSYYTGLCPVHAERSPSFSVKNNGFKCYACGFEGYGVIDFIMKKEGLDFKSAMEFLKKDMIVNNNRKIILPKKVIIEKPMDIQFVDGNFNDDHKKYWEKLEMDQIWLNKKNVFAVKEWAMGPEGKLKKMNFTKDEIAFAYYAEDIQKCKILRLGPEVTPDLKWRTNVPNNYLWYYNDKIVYNRGFVVKSVKDCLVVQKLNRQAIATNNESDRILLDNNVDKINKIYKDVVMCYGSDPDGKSKSIKITKETGWKWFNIENHLYEQYGIEDFADYLNSGFTYKQLDRLFKNKKL